MFPRKEQIIAWKNTFKQKIGNAKKVLCYFLILTTLAIVIIASAFIKFLQYLNNKIS